MTLEVSAVQAQEIGRLRSLAPEVRCVVIGAVAVQHYVQLPRSTGDVDLVLDVEPQRLSEILTAVGWKQDERAKQRWRGPNQFVTDVLPASPRLIQKGFVQFDDDEKKLSLVGFDLLFEHAEELDLPDDQGTVLVATWPSLVVLKMVSWLDRPHERKRDLQDIGTILSHILPENDERRWELNIPGDFNEQSPRFAGQEVAKIAAPSHRAAIQRFLDEVLSDAASWIQHVGEGMQAQHERHAERMVRAFGEGVGELREKMP